MWSMAPAGGNPEVGESGRSRGPDVGEAPDLSGGGHFGPCALRARNISAHVTDATRDLGLDGTILVGFARSKGLALPMHWTLAKEEPSC